VDRVYPQLECRWVCGKGERLIIIRDPSPHKDLAEEKSNYKFATNDNGYHRIILIGGNRSTVISISQNKMGPNAVSNIRSDRCYEGDFGNIEPLNRRKDGNIWALN